VVFSGRHGELPCNPCRRERFIESVVSALPAPLGAQQTPRRCSPALIGAHPRRVHRDRARGSAPNSATLADYAAPTREPIAGAPASPAQRLVQRLTEREHQRDDQRDDGAHTSSRSIPGSSGRLLPRPASALAAPLRLGKTLAATDASRKLARSRGRDVELQRQLIALAVKEATRYALSQRLIASRNRRRACRAEPEIGQGFFERRHAAEIPTCPGRTSGRGQRQGGSHQARKRT